MVNNKIEFSIVIPIKGTSEELKFIDKTLPSYYAVNPSELVISIDDPPEEKAIMPKIKAVAKSCRAEEKTRILNIKIGNNGWNDQQMKARYTGFLNAKYDRILTGDIDLVINKNVLKAVKLVGKDGIGLVSCSKLRVPHDFLSFYRMFGEMVLKKVAHRFPNFGATSFTGLYAVWKPYWLDVLTIDVAKKFTKLKSKVRQGLPVTVSDFYGSGDDTFLRDLMVKKYKCVYLTDVGATVLTDPWEDRPIIQYGKGVYFASMGRKMIISVGRAIVRAQPYYIVGYLHGRKIKDAVTGLEFKWNREK
jgi:hypothetical protein